MVIRSANRRLAIRLWLIAVLVDVVVAGVISHFLSPSDDFWTNTFWIWLGLQLAVLILMLLGVLHLLVAKWMGGLRPVRDGLVTALESQDFPVPKGIISSVDNYFSDIADGQEYSIETRLAAAVLLGVRQGIREATGVVRWLMIDSAHEEALKEYASRRT